MLWTPQASRTSVITNGGIVGSATPWTAVPSNGTTLLDGAVTELISAANNIQDSWGFEVHINATGASATIANACIDLLIGGATDDVLASGLICGYCIGGSAAAVGSIRYFFPVHIPAGLRIAATHANVRTSTNARVGIWLYGGSPPPFRVGRKITTIGTPADNARGVVLTVAASGGTAGVTEMTASSADDYFYVVPGFQPHSDTTITPGGFVNVGIGVGASTEQRIGTWWFGKDSGESMVGPIPTMGAFCNVDAGQRLTMLCSNSGTNDAGYNGLIYAVS
jgi:hypothetical protein